MTRGTLSRTLTVVVAAALAFPAAVAGQAPAPPAPEQHGGHAGHESDHPSPDPAEQSPPGGLPPITDEDRAAAFPTLNGQHTVHDEAIFTYVLLDQLEWQGKGVSGAGWDGSGWIGGDVSRFWFRSEGEGETGGLKDAEAHALYGRAIARWWEVVAGVRQDVRPGPARTWAAVGIQGLAPYWFEVEATAYVGQSGRTQFRLEAEYELLFTNRLILQPAAGLEVHGKDDPGRGTGAGLSSMDAGLRLRYEVRREFAPYLGMTWNRKFFRTADLAKAEDGEVSSARLALGLRMWF